MQYHIDIVICIDCTGSMASVIDRTKLAAMRFDEDLFTYMKHVQKDAAQLRVKVIAFRDYYADKSGAMSESDFFELPAQRDRFQTFLSGLRAEGGGDEPENALEALSLAMQSDWSSGGDKRRHCIVVWTDASAHPLERRSSATPLSAMPADRLPRDLNQLTDWWEGERMNDSSRRLVIFAPDAYPWRDMTSWDQSIWYPSRAGDGLNDHDYTKIIQQIAQSVEGGGQ